MTDPREILTLEQVAARQFKAWDEGVIRNVRTRSLHPDYEYRPVPEHGTGWCSVHRLTGEVCECRMEWHLNGSVLLCPVCYLDGT